MYKVEKTLFSVLKNHYHYEKPRVSLKRAIDTKFYYFVEKAKTFLVEDYIENEWRDSYDLYYSKTSYNCNNIVKRIHFITEEIESYKDVSQGNYIGYITIRPIPVVNSVLSRIRLLCSGEAFDMDTKENIFHCLSTDTIVNFPHTVIRYKSFPLYSQDSMVAVCAHADILMISKYMYKKYNFNNYKLKDIVGNTALAYNTFGRKIPSEGLTVYQMVELLKVNNYNPTAVLFKNGNYNDKIDIIEYIDSYLESALPVIVAFSEHVSIIIGHVHNNKRHYIIADDSSYHLVKHFGKRPSHIEIVSEDKLRTVFSDKEVVYIITPSFDRFYLQFPYLNIIIKEAEEMIINMYFQGRIDINLQTREILVESSRLKQFLHSCGDESFADIPMPHYVWYVEFYLHEKSLENLSFYMIIDAASHKNDRQYSIIKNKNYFPIITAKRNMVSGIRQLSLLTEI